MNFRIQSTKLSDWLSDFAKQTGGEIKGNKVIIPQSMGEGFFELVEFTPSFYAAITELKLKEPVPSILLKVPSFMEGYFQIHLFNQKDQSTLFYNDHRLGPKMVSTNGVFFGSAEQSRLLGFEVGKTTSVVTLLFSSPSVREFFPDIDNEYLEGVFYSGRPFLMQHPITPDLQKIAAKLIFPSVNSSVRGIFLHGKSLEFISLLLDSLEEKYLGKFEFTAKPDDITRILQVREQILTDLNAHPGIPELASVAVMSESKLHKTFKQVFGKSVYQYRLEARMEVARLQLISREYSVKEVGYSLGYSNISQFIKAFKKAYGKTPKSYLKEYSLESGE